MSGRGREAKPSRWALVFEGQLLQVAILLGLLLGVAALRARLPGMGRGEILGLSSDLWFAIGLVGPILHQAWVFLWWRSALHLDWPHALFGASAFPIYRAGFLLFAVWRVAPVFLLAVANAGSLDIDPTAARLLAGAMVVPVAWLVWSIARHFGITRALGGDHFFARYRSLPLCRAGIFRAVPHAMYTVGFLALWIPALVWRSEAALVLAAFNHIGIWAHWFATEKPDLRRLHESDSRPA